MFGHTHFMENNQKLLIILAVKTLFYEAKESSSLLFSENGIECVYSL